MEEEMAVEARNRSRSSFCWKKRTVLEKFLICAIVLTIIIAASATAVAKAHSFRSSTDDDEDDQTSLLPRSKATRDSNKNATATICNTIPCLQVACRLLNNMDRSVNPCENFYQYACGGWVKQQDNEEEQALSVLTTEMPHAMAKALKNILESEGSDDDLEAFKKARTYYQSCMQKYNLKQGFAAAKIVLDEIGTIYDNDTVWKNTTTTTANLTTLLYNLFIRNGAPLFQIGYDIQSRNASDMIVMISLPEHKSIIGDHDQLKLSTPQVATRAVDDDDVKSKPDVNFKNATKPRSSKGKPNITIDGAFIYKIIQDAVDNETNKNLNTILRKYFGRSGNNSQQKRLEGELRTFLSNLKNLVPVPKVLSKAQFNDETHQKYSIRQLSALFTHVNWKTLLQLLFNRPFSDDDVVAVDYPPYLKDLQELISKTNSRIVNNGALASYARDILWELIHYDEKERWKFCVDATKVVFPAPLSALYMRTFSPNHLKQMQRDAEDLFNNLKKSFQTIIENNKWLDSQSKERLQLKLSNMIGIFVSSNLLHNDSYIDETVENITVSDDNFIADTVAAYNTITMNEYLMDTEDQRSFEKELSLMFNTYDINAYHITSMNVIAMPLGFLTPPNYIGGQPMYVTYGGIGSTLAHEITHGFDASGIHHDEYGEKRQWLTNRTIEQYKDRSQCYVDAYSEQDEIISFGGKNVVLHVDGSFTLGENLADNVGQEMAYLAYKDWLRRHEEEPLLTALNLSADQLFLISEAQTFCGMLSPTAYVIAMETDEHTPDPERINALAMNSEKFAEAFHCPIGSEMNPFPKCHMW